MTSKKRAILIFGPPGIGKGTQSEMIGDKDHYVHFSTGELFRKLEHLGDAGKEVQEYIDKRELVPDATVMRLADAEIERLIKEGTYDPEKQLILLDGIPRDKEQVGLVADRYEVLQIIDLYCGDEHVLVERITKRAEIEGREDDKNPETVKHGLEVYHQKTEEILNAYDPSIVVKIDGSGTLEEIHDAIMEKIVKP